jgi:hypothetical protein
MGLDMYAYSSNVKDVECEVNPEKEIEEQTNELACWRKHNRLHGWFQNKWEKKVSGMDIEHPFNCVRLYLSRSDLDELEFDLKENSCQLRKAFSLVAIAMQMKLNYNKNNLNMIWSLSLKQKKNLKKGRHVYYTSWW